MLEPNIEYLFLLFIIYSVFGWLIESTLVSIQMRKFTNRGFLIGPYCPVYGLGALIITILLSNFSKNIILLFIISMLLCSFVEYLTSLILEKLFHAHWWDYSNKKCNLNGRICLENCILFGIGGIFIIKIFNPIFFKLISLIPTSVFKIINILFLIFFFLDSLISTIIISQIGHKSRLEVKDSTVEISSEVKLKLNQLKKQMKDITPEDLRKLVKNIEIKINELTENVSSSFSKKSYIHTRILKVYPSFKIYIPGNKRIIRKANHKNKKD